MAAHRIYGLGVRANVPIAGLNELATVPDTDISLVIGAMPGGLDAADPAPPFYVSDDRDASGVPLLVVSRLMDGAYYRLHFADGTRVVLDSRAAQIWATVPADATIDDTAAYILGPALGFALQLRGVTCLHASCVRMGDCAVAFVGAAGAGKSTLAACFARRGQPILTDDLAPLMETVGGFEIPPAYPRIRLWPDSVASLFGHADALPRITPTWDKRFLGLAGRYRFASSPLPLAAIFILGEREAGAPRIESLSARQALIALVRETYSSRLLDRERRAKEFEVLTRLLDRLDVHRLVASSDPSRLDEACEIVERHIAGAPAIHA
jgi:hypothetical protein